MASLGQIGEVITEQVHERVDRLVSAVGSDTPDFKEIANAADSVGELADTIADLYVDLERRLLGGLNGNDDARESRAQRPRHSRQQQQQTHQRQQQQTRGESASDEPTKEELLEQARELHVDGRSSMTKEELVEAVEAEEGVTKEELLERAREANIEGRSSMTKEELRDALHASGA